MATYLVTGATVGDTGRVGDLRAANAAGNAVTFGIEPLAVSPAVVHRGEAAAALLIELQGGYIAPLGTAVTLALSGAPLVLGTAGDALLVGRPSVANAARSVYPVGWASAGFGPAARANDGGAGNSVALDLSGVYVPSPSLNVGMYLDGRPLVSSAGVGEQSALGAPKLEQPQSARPLSIAAGPLGSVRVYPAGATGASVLLDMADSATASLPLRMDFDPQQRPVLPAGLVATRFGGAALVNAAQAAYPPGSDTAQFGPQTWTHTDESGAGLVLDLTGNYAPPNAQAIQMVWASEDKELGPVGIAQDAYGVPALALAAQGAFAQGWVAAGWGMAEVRGAGHQVEPVGYVATTYGKATLVNVNRDVRPVGLAAFQGFGTATVTLGTRRLSQGGLGDQSAFGTAMLAGGVRWVDLAGRGLAAGTVGGSTVWFAVRELLPLWFAPTSYGTPLVDFHHTVVPAGFGGEAPGQPDVHYPRSIVDLAGTGLGPEAWGAHRADLYTRPVAPVGWMDGAVDEPHRFGLPLVWNLRQVVAQLFEVTPSDGGVFGTFNAVANRDRAVPAEGIAPGRIGALEVYNNARVLTAPPNTDFSVWGDALVAPAIRMLAPQGDETLQWGSPLGNVVYNAAPALASVGVPPGSVSEPARVWSNLQGFDHAGGDDHARLGSPMVAFAVRTVAPYALPDPPPFGDAKTQLWERYLRPAGVEAGRPGVPTLEIHWTVIAPSSALAPANAFGDGRVWNLTPELHALPWVATQWGLPALHNQWERYAFGGFDALFFGRHIVADRRQRAAPLGIDSFVLLPKHQVHNALPDPPAPQTIEAEGFTLLSYVGLHALRYNSVYPVGWAEVRFGVVTAANMGIVPKGITPPYNDSGTQLGIPNLPATQTVYPEQRPEPLTAWGVARLSPAYIWAPLGCPWNPPGDHGEYIDAQHQGDAERPHFGAVTVTLGIRQLRVQQNTISGVVNGAERVSVSPQYVRGEGVKLTKFGYPVLNGGGATQTYGSDCSVFGQTEVVFAPHVGPWTVGAMGLAAPGFGAARVEFFNRELGARGFATFTTSAPGGLPPDDITNQWTWVSRAYDPFPVLGLDASSFGAAWVSFRVREVAPAGTDTFVSDWEAGHFADRMRVRNQRWVAPTGIAPGDTGAARGELAVRTAAPRGWMDARLGAAALRAQLRVSVSPGLDAGAFGDVQRWEAGKAAPHGEDMAQLGRAVIGRALHPTSFGGVVGDARIAAGIASAGTAPAALGAPTATAQWCGNRAVAYAGFDALQIGTNEVAHA